MEVSQSLRQIIWLHFIKHRFAVAGLICILLLASVAIFADAITWGTGLKPEEQNIAHRYLPPLSRTTASVDQLEQQIEVFLKSHPNQAQLLGQTLIATQQLVTLDPEESLFELAQKEPLQREQIFSYIVSSESYQSQTELKNALDIYKNIYSQNNNFYLLGTDELGRDVFIRLVYGTRVSLGVGFLVALASALIGLLIGSLAGYFGGWVDTVLMRITDALLSLPTIPVLIIVAAIDINKVPALKNLISSSHESIYKMVFILCLFSWMTVALLVRGSILSLKERDFILAAKTLGATDFTIIVRHIFPNVLAPILVSITLGVGESILFEAALSFLGLGIMPPTASWGNMLNNAQELIYQAPFLAVLPGFLILLTTMSFNFIGDGLQSALDPKSLKR